MFAYSWYAVSVRSLGIEESIQPDPIWSCVGPHAGTKFIIVSWSAYGKHELPAAELSVDDVESEVQVSAVSATEFTCGSHRQMLIGTYFPYFFIATFTSYRQISNKLFPSTTSHVMLMKEINVDGWKKHVLDTLREF